MRRIADKNLAELLIQLRFTPLAKRLKQIQAAEELVGTIDPAKEYPWDFVYYKITGFMPPDQGGSYLIPGSQLLEDLRIFVTRLSTIACPSADQTVEPVYTIKEVASRLNVSEKTINRWRKRGLAARRFVFQDGAKRLGIRQSVLEAFIAKHRDLTDKAIRFTRLDDKQKRQVIELAARLAGSSSGSLSQIIQEVAHQTGRATETIRYTIKAYLKSHPEHPLARRVEGRSSAGDAQRLYELYRSGVPIKDLVERFGLSRTTIYRLINQRRALALMARRIQYVPSPEFEDPAIREQIISEAIELPSEQPDLGRLPDSTPGSEVLPAYIRLLKHAQPILASLETRLFRRYNCLKYMAVRCRQAIKLSNPSGSLLSQAEAYLAQADSIERALVAGYLRLVVAIASKHATDEAQFADLVSKGNYALITAIQEFDYTKGIRFARQTALNIAKEYAKTSGREIEITRRRAASIASMQMYLRDSADLVAVERARQGLMEVIHRELDQRQQYVIMNHFGLAQAGPKRKGKTLQQIGQELGVSKERVRQIELVALQRLRRSLSPEQFDLLTR
ncbi:MAG: sigma-70 family RNA polymerase sigma factor [Sedimentisphaerales bacterium]|jgi:RNA polymerase sigma factor (sigma-70 family)|nr:sigma-70 family RNA polymerase sigma factor [Sedimentisphaerales bacterium]